VLGNEGGLCNHALRLLAFVRFTTISKKRKKKATKGGPPAPPAEGACRNPRAPLPQGRRTARGSGEAYPVGVCLAVFGWLVAKDGRAREANAAQHLERRVEEGDVVHRLRELQVPKVRWMKVIPADHSAVSCSS
jgi:hypothetical protein